MARVALEHSAMVYPDGMRAVRDLTLGAEDGALLVPVGPSGRGKTTALRMVAGLEDVSAGELRIGDRVVQPDAMTCGQRVPVMRRRTVQQVADGIGSAATDMAVSQVERTGAGLRLSVGSQGPAAPPNVASDTRGDIDAAAAGSTVIARVGPRGDVREQAGIRRRVATGRTHVFDPRRGGRSGARRARERTGHEGTYPGRGRGHDARARGVHGRRRPDRRRDGHARPGGEPDW